MPQLINKQTVFPLTAEEMGPLMLPIVDAGATYVGGCCGTTPAHIQSISDAVKAHTPKERAHIEPKTIITSRTKLLELGHNTKPLIIGERINPTGRKVLLKSYAMVLSSRKTRCVRPSRSRCRHPRRKHGCSWHGPNSINGTCYFELSMLVETHCPSIHWIQQPWK